VPGRPTNPQRCHGRLVAFVGSHGPTTRAVREAFVRHSLKVETTVSSFHGIKSPPHLTNEFSHVRLDCCGVYLPDNGSLSRHIGNPTHHAYPYPAHSTPSVYDTSSLSVDSQGIYRSSNTWMTPMAGSFEGPLIRHIASPNESLGHPIRGDLYTCTHNLQLQTDAAQARSERRRRLKCSPKTHSWIYLVSINWTP
jgi:hypothetical protein